MISRAKMFMLASAAGLTVWLLYRSLKKSNRSANAPPVVEVIVSPIESESSNACDLDPRIVTEVTAILQSLALQKRPSPVLIARLRAILVPLSEDCVSQIKSISDEVSFGISEWIFYHTLRTNKSIAWNPVTGIVDQTMTPDEKILGEKLARNMRKAYWANHVADLDASNYTCVIDRLLELDDRINAFRPQNFRHPIFDLVLTRQQIDHKTFDRPFLFSLARAAVDAMADLESPATHEETVAWIEREESAVNASFNAQIVNVLAFLFGQLDVLDAELANFKSAQLSAVARRSKEREVFQSLVANGTIHVVGIEKMLGTISEKSNLNIFLRFKEYFLNELSVEGSLIESLAPDLEAIQQFRAEIKAVEMISAFCVAINSLGCACSSHAEMKEFVVQVYDAICTDSDTDLVAAVRVKFPTVDPTKALSNCMAASSQVRTLYTRRILALMNTAIVPGPIEGLSSNSLGTSPWYLSVGVDKLNNLMIRVTEFMADHLQVYLPVYQATA